jgi:hypothetical protein
MIVVEQKEAFRYWMDILVFGNGLAEMQTTLYLLSHLLSLVGH